MAIKLQTEKDNVLTKDFITMFFFYKSPSNEFGVTIFTLYGSSKTSKTNDLYCEDQIQSFFKLFDLKQVMCKMPLSIRHSTRSSFCFNRSTFVRLHKDWFPDIFERLGQNLIKSDYIFGFPEETEVTLYFFFF